MRCFRAHAEPDLCTLAMPSLAIEKGREQGMIGLLIGRVAPYVVVWMVNVIVILLLGALLLGVLFLVSPAPWLSPCGFW